ncbi:hypothetical protein ACQ1PL_07115 [Ornithobacterium rhinotracheale]
MKTKVTPTEQNISREPFPNSEKVYVQGSLFEDVLVPMRKITLSDTIDKFKGTKTPNDPVFVYDTSGAYTDPNIEIDVRKGL